MARPKRIAKGNIVYHVLNRANGRLRIFKKRRDFEAFEEILAEGAERLGGPGRLDNEDSGNVRTGIDVETKRKTQQRGLTPLIIQTTFL